MGWGTEEEAWERELGSQVLHSFAKTNRSVLSRGAPSGKVSDQCACFADQVKAFWFVLSLFFKPGILLDVKLLYSSSLAFLKAVHQMGRDALILKVPFRGKRNKLI